MEFVILAFAVFGVSEAVTRTDGPFNIFYKLKHMKHSKAFECFTCLSFWVAFVLAAVATPDISTWIMYALGSAGAAIFLDYIADTF